MILNMK